MIYKTVFKSVLILLLFSVLINITGCLEVGNQKEQKVSSGYVFLENISYGDDKRQIFDIIIPDMNSNCGVVVMFHGGAWTDGGKGEFDNIMYNFYRDGFTFASVDYRFASEDISMNDIIDDITSALIRIRLIASEHGIDLKKAMLGGISAGGQLALLYSYAKKDCSPIDIKCCVGMSAVCDMSARSVWIDNPLDEYLSKNHSMAQIGSHLCKFKFDKSNFNDAVPYLKKISPLSYVENAIPTILAHGLEDDIIDYSSAVTLYDSLVKNGIECSFISFTKSGHMLEGDPLRKIEMNKLISQYAKTYLQ